MKKISQAGFIFVYTKQTKAKRARLRVRYHVTVLLVQYIQ